MFRAAWSALDKMLVNALQEVENDSLKDIKHWVDNEALTIVKASHHALRNQQVFDAWSKLQNIDPPYDPEPAEEDPKNQEKLMSKLLEFYSSGDWKEILLYLTAHHYNFIGLWLWGDDELIEVRRRIAVACEGQPLNMNNPSDDMRKEIRKLLLGALRHRGSGIENEDQNEKFKAWEKRAKSLKLRSGEVDEASD